MRFFHAPLFAQTIQSFQLIQDNCEFATRSGSGSSHLPDAKVELLISTVQDARAWCERTLLHASVKKLDLSLMHFKAECASLSWTAAGVEVRNIIESIMLEAQGIWLVAIEPDRVQVLTIVQPFGADVEESFPAAATDIREASLCLAMERNTAAVFHLMRAAEYGIER